MRCTKIQIVEDDRALSDGIRLTLQEPNLDFIQSAAVSRAKKDYERENADIVILDVNLPDGSGYDYLKWLKERSDALVLILTANDLETDEVMGLTLGADDYMTKPFSLAVLRARIGLFLQRLERRNASPATERKGGSSGEKRAKENHQYREDDFVFDFERLEFWRGESEISLSINEQKLLRLFVENPARVLTRTVLIDRLWSDGGEFVDENALSVTVNRLRGKLEDKKSSVSYIQTVYGQGYQWKKREKE